jgi:hypothetical protein
MKTFLKAILSLAAFITWLYWATTSFVNCITWAFTTGDALGGLLKLLPVVLTTAIAVVFVAAYEHRHANKITA